MIRKFKTLGLAFVAVLAMSAVVASASQAANFTASSYPASFTTESAKGNDTFKTEAGTVECKAHFEGSLAAASESILVKPKYTECQAFGLAAEVTVGANCYYQFTTSQEVHVVAVGGTCVIVIHTATCTTQLNPQTGLKTVDLNNNAATTDITAQATVTGIAYEVTKDGFACPYNGTGKKTGATYTQHNPLTIQDSSGKAIHIG